MSNANPEMDEAIDARRGEASPQRHREEKRRIGSAQGEAEKKQGGIEKGPSVGEFGAGRLLARASNPQPPGTCLTEMQEPQLIPGSFSPRFAAFFASYVRWRTRRCFHAVRIAQPEVLRGFEADASPLIVMMNHPGWWDPLTAVLVQQALLRGRPGMAPMDQTQLEKFRFFRHLGLFGIDPDESKNKTAMLEYVHREWARSPRTVLWITPQGRFADVRAELELRPGAAAIAARTPGVRVVSLSIEYSFWLDQRPEMFLRLAPVAGPEKPSMARWHRALKEGMAENAAALAELVIARNPWAFESLLESRAGINPAMNFLLRLRGKSPDIDSARVLHAPGVKETAR